MTEHHSALVSHRFSPRPRPPGGDSGQQDLQGAGRQPRERAADGGLWEAGHWCEHTPIIFLLIDPSCLPVLLLKLLPRLPAPPGGMFVLGSGAGSGPQSRWSHRDRQDDTESSSKQNLTTDLSVFFLHVFAHLQQKSKLSDLFKWFVDYKRQILDGDSLSLVFSCIFSTNNQSMNWDKNL